MSEPQLPYYRASAGLRARVEAAVRAPQRSPRVMSQPAARWLGLAAALVLTAASAWTLGRRGGAVGGGEEASLLSAHLRSLTPNHLTEVASSDRHTVKPWFAGKLDFSPPVADPKDAGFPLVGGRVDYVGGRPAAALVYTRRNHVINVFVQPIPAGESPRPGTTERQGYHIVQWASSGMWFCAVSDLNAPELGQLRDLLVAQRER
jgi:anti-sigma factor RsiW